MAMLLNEFTSVLQVRSRDELLAETVRFTRRLGFDTVSATAVADRLFGESEFVWVDNTPAAYRVAFENWDNARRDPVTQYCRWSSLPIVWNQQTYIAAGKGAKWEEQAHFGYRTGIGYALHLPEGRHFFVAVDRDQPLPASPAEVTRMTGDLQLFAVHALDAALRVLQPTSVECDVPNLTPRERESLRWTMEGKTAWELGRILSISEQTAARHVNNAMHKLNCVSKHQAVIRALRMGIIR